MHQFEDWVWVDYVRGIAGETETAAMTAHLATRCARCERTVRAFADLARVAVEETCTKPPDHVVYAARGIFGLRQPDRVRILPGLATRLVFDSFMNPLPAGVRGQPMTRQVLYEAGPYAVDLQLDHAHGSRRIWLTGQIASTDPAHRIDRVNVMLTAASGQVAKNTYTNSAGEFQIEYEPQPQLQLRIDVRPDEHIDLPILPQPDDPAHRGQR